MAKKRKTKKHTTHRRRRMSGVGSGLGHEAMEVLGLVGGGILTAVVQRQMVSVSPKITAAAGLAAGFLIKKHAKSPLMTGLGYGMMATSATHLAHEFHAINGIEDFVSGMSLGDTYTEEREMRGISNNDMMSGLGNNNTVTGMESGNVMSGMMNI